MPKTPPGSTRRRVYEFVRERLLAGHPPAMREIAAAFGFRAVQTVKEHLDALVSEGLLTANPGLARGYRLPKHPGAEFPLSYVPLLGRVRAGGPTEALEDVEGYVPVVARRGGDGAGAADLFALRVRGDSMTGVGILDGDLVIVRRQPTAASGDIVVAQVAGEATVKRLKLTRDRAELHPENPAYALIVPPPGELQVVGKVIEVRRRLEPASAS